MRREDEKRLGKMQQRARKDRAEEARIRKQNERLIPLILSEGGQEKKEQK